MQSHHDLGLLKDESLEFCEGAKVSYAGILGEMDDVVITVVVSKEAKDLDRGVRSPSMGEVRSDVGSDEVEFDVVESKATGRVAC